MSKDVMAIIKNRAPQNKVYSIVRNYSGKVTAVLEADHDGTFEGMIRTARKLHADADMSFEWQTEFYNINSQTLASTSAGKVYNISPNLLHVAEYGTDDFNYCFGDISCRR